MKSIKKALCCTVFISFFNFGMQAPSFSGVPLPTKSLHELLVDAIETDNLNEVRRLIEIGANPNTKTREGIPILVIAVRKQNLQLVQLLLSFKNTNPNEQTDKFKNTALTTAAALHNFPILQELLNDPRVLINLTDGTGHTALDAAALKKFLPSYPEIERLLKARGAQPGITQEQPRMRYERFSKPIINRPKYDSAVYRLLDVEPNASPRQILGVPSNASPEEIKAAWRTLTQKWHPDKNPDPNAKEVFKLITWAYETLTVQQGKK